MSKMDDPHILSSRRENEINIESHMKKHGHIGFLTIRAEDL